MATPAAVLSILVKAQGVQSTAGQLKGLDAAGRNAGKGMAVAETGAKRSSRAFTAVGTAAKSAGLLVGAAGLAAGIKTAVSEFREAQKVSGQTSAVLKSTGRQAGVTKKHIEDLAGAISKKSGIDDEAIQSSENLLLTFTKVRNETGKGNKIFDQATQVVTDMSVALGQSGKSSAIQLGKALNDPIKGITALRRVGVSFTAQQQEQIKKMVESGDLLGAQRKIIKELKTEFGGSAAAQATAGDKLKVSLGNLAEAAGGVLVPQLDKAANALTKLINDFVEGKGIAKVIIPAFFSVRDALASTIPVVTQVVKWFGEHRKITLALVAALGLAFAPLTTWAVLAVVAYKKSELFRNAVQAVVSVVLGLPAAVTGAFNSVRATVVGVMTAVQTELGKWDVGVAVAKAAMAAIVLAVRTSLALLAPLFTAAFGVIKAVVSGAFAAIKAIVQGGLQVIRGIVQVFGGVLKGDFGQIWEGIKNIFRGVGAAIAGILRAQLGTVKAAGTAMGKGLIAGFKAALNLAHELAVAMRDLISKAPAFALGVGQAIVRGIINGIKGAASGIGDALKGAVKGATPDFLGIGDGIGKSIGAGAIVPVKGGGSLMGARPIMSRFAAVGAANGLHVSSGLRSGAITSSGNQSYHSTGEAIDLAGSPAGMMKTFKTLRSRFGSKLAELIYTPGGAGIKDGKSNVYTGQVAADHFDHVHVAFDSGKPGLGDGLGKMQATGAGIGDGVGSNVKAAWQFLISKGFTPAQAAGIIGGLMGESGKGLSTTATNPSSKAFGIGQWLGDRKSALMGRKNPKSLQTQLEFLWSELQGSESGAFKSVKGSKSIADTVKAWVLKFERPEASGRNIGSRTASAQAVFKALKGTGGKTAGAGAAAGKVNPFDQAIASADVAIADARTHKVGGVGGRYVGADLAKASAILDKQKVVGARIRKVRAALKGKLSKGTRLRLTQELGQLLPQHKQLGLDRQEVLRGPAATDISVGGGVDTGPTEDPNQALIDSNAALQASIDAQVAAEKEHTDALNAVKDEIKRQNDIAGSTIGIGLREAQRALADIVSNQLGVQVGQRALTAGSGVGVRY